MTRIHQTCTVLAVVVCSSIARVGAQEPTVASAVIAAEREAMARWAIHPVSWIPSQRM